MSELALDEMGVTAWNDPGEWTKLKVADLACGSGTLLNGWIEAAKDRMRAAGADDARCSAWHKKAVEELTTGLDINPVSLQLAAGRFTLGNLDVDYRKMALHCLEHGRVSGDVRLGTLELLGDDEIIGCPPETFAWDDDDVVHPDVKSALTGIRAVVINPPFSDNAKRYRNVDAATKKAMQRREMAIRDRVTASDAEAGKLIDTNSIRTFFTPVIDSVLSRDDGVLAKILPMTACTAASGREERQFLASRFWIKYVVMCHDPKNINLSQETGINECLLIGTRRGASDGRATMFVNLSRYPVDTNDARVLAAALREGDFDAIGRATEWPAERVHAGDWSPLQWYDGRLSVAAFELSENKHLKNAGELYGFGPAGQRIRDEFVRKEAGDLSDQDIRIFDSIDESLRISLTGERDGVWRGKTRNVKGEYGITTRGTHYLNRASHVVLAHAFRTTTSRTTSQHSPTKSVGNRYIPVLTDSDAEAKAVNVLWNSTSVLLQLLSKRTGMAAYVSWSVEHLKSVRLPAVAREPSLVRALASVHDELANVEIGRLQYAAEDPVRATIDDATAKLFGLAPETVAEWRNWLSREPFMYNTSPVDD